MTRVGYFVRLAVSLAIDIADMTIGRLFIGAPGLLGDVVGGAIMYLLWGPAGLAYLWEAADVTEQIDGFIPTATLIGLVVGWRNGMLTGKPQTPRVNDRT
jgi:hypothetical protein